VTPARFSLTPRGPFSLAASARFLEGFAPAADPTTPEGGLRMAFCVEGGWEPTAVSIEQAQADGAVAVRSTGEADRARLREQVGRMLSLRPTRSWAASHTGSAWPRRCRSRPR